MFLQAFQANLLFTETFLKGRLNRSIKATFLTSIPKYKGADEVTGCIPISVMGKLYKIIFKVLENKIKKVVKQMILPFRDYIWKINTGYYPSKQMNSLIEGNGRKGLQGWSVKLITERL